MNKLMNIGRLVIVGLVTWGVATHALPAFSEPIPEHECPNSISTELPAAGSGGEGESVIEKWMVGMFWKQLQTKMTPEMVTDLLGEPLEKEESSLICVWYYQNRPVKLEGGAIQRPRCGLVTFKKVQLGEQAAYAVKAWKEPNWYETPCFTTMQFKQQAAKLEKLKREAEAEKLRAERTRLAEEKRIEREQARQQQMEQEREQTLASQQAAEKEALWMGYPRKYWYIGGGALGGLGLILLVFKKPV